MKTVLERKMENNTERKVAMFRVKQQQDYAFKVRYAEIRAWEFFNHPEVDDFNPRSPRGERL